MKNKLEYRIENGSLIIDNYFNDLKIGSINGGSVENILKKCKLYDEEYKTLLKENEYMNHIAKDFEQLQQENKHLDEVNCKLRKRIGQLEDNWNKLKEIIKKKQDYYRHFKDNRYRKFLSELLDKMQELERSDNK